MQYPDWRGEGIVVDKRDHRALVLIPALGLELRLHLEQDVPLNSTVPLMLRGINLAELDVHFQIIA
jgi:exoribonuclease-2